MAQAGVAVHLLDDLRAGFRSERPAGEQCGGVFVERPSFHFSHERLEIVRGAAGKAVQIPRRDRIRGEIHDVRQIVPRRELDRVELQDDRDQHDAVQVDVRPLQVAGEHCRTGGPIALAEEVTGRIPAVVLAEEAPHELREGARIFVDAPVIGPFGAFTGMAETGADGIHHHDVGDIENRVVVIRERVGRRALGADLGSDHAPRPHDAHVEPEGSRSRPAVVSEHERALAGRHAVRAEVGGIEEFGSVAALFVGEGHARHHRVVLDGFLPDDDGVADLPAGLRGVCLLGRGCPGEEQQEGG